MSEETPLDTQKIARIAGRIDRPIVLVGLMGVGKSTVGRKLAEMLKRDFVDADEEIEDAAQRSISARVSLSIRTPIKPPISAAAQRMTSA